MASGSLQTCKTELVSIVLPTHNEEANVCRIHEAIRVALQHTPLGAEIIFVDDGSSDSTAAQVGALCKTDPLVRLVRLSRNFGHQAALLAGVRASTGSAVITMDCDLQHPPGLLPTMIEQWRSGAVIVQMARTNTEGAGLFKKWSSALYYRLMRVMSDYPVLLGPDFQLLDRSVVDIVLGFRESRPFLRGLVAWVGFPVCRLEFVAPGRTAGRSSFSLRKMIRMALDGMTALSTKPLRVATSVGFVISILCCGYAAFSIACFIRGISVPGWTSLIVTVLFLGALQLLSIGILGEYIGRIYELSRNVPPYVTVETAVGTSTANEAETPLTDTQRHDASVQSARL